MSYPVGTKIQRKLTAVGEAQPGWSRTLVVTACSVTNEGMSLTLSTLGGSTHVAWVTPTENIYRNVE
jgi:hypothetical protein